MANFDVKTATGPSIVNALGGALPSLSVGAGGFFYVKNSDGGTLTVTFQDGNGSPSVTVIASGVESAIGVDRQYYYGSAYITFAYTGVSLTINGVVNGPVLSFIPTGYPIAMSDLKSFFASTVTNLHAYYRGGGIVQDIPENSNITNSPTAQIELSDFINSAKAT